MSGITEPATLVTDYLLAAFTAVLGWRLWRAGGRPQRWWAAAFGATAVAGLAGGSVHGFRTLMPDAVTGALWLFTLEAILAAAAAVVAATMMALEMTPGARRGATAAVIAGYGAYGIWIAGRPRFVFAIAGYGVALLIVAAFQRRGALSHAPHSVRLVQGVALSAVAAIVQQGGWGPASWFNHNDLYHVIQAVAVWFLYRGARLTPLRASTSANVRRRPVDGREMTERIADGP